MNRIRFTQTAAIAAVAIAMAGSAFAQSSYPNTYPNQYPQTTYPQTTYPSNTYPQNSYPNNGYPSAQSTMSGTVTRVSSVYDADIAARTGQRRCYNQRTGQYTIEPAYPDNNYPGSYRTEPVQRGTTAGNVMSGIAGSVIGGVIGSKIGGGLGSVIASSVGASIGTMAGQQIYRNAQMPQGTTTVCEPIASNDNRQYNAYDVQYRIGNQYGTVRTTQYYRVGDTIQINVSTGY